MRTAPFSRLACALALALWAACALAQTGPEAKAQPEAPPPLAKPDEAPAPPAETAKNAAARMDEADAALKRGETKKAFEIVLALAKENDAKAQLRAAQMLDAGQGVEASCPQAGEWLAKAANQGLPEAQNLMGERARKGYCAAKSYKEAARWYLKAAYQNYPPALKNLAYMFDNYALGARGAKQIAYFWAVLAAKADPSAADMRDRIMASLIPVQIEQAQARANAWTPGKEFEAMEEMRQAKYGTGFLVGRKGYVLTNAHVVRGFKYLSGEIDGKAVKLSLVKIDDAIDLAVLKLDQPAGEGLKFRAGAAPKPGEAVVAIGFPLRGLLSKEPAVTTGNLSALAGMKNDKRFIQFTAPVQPGNSGGPLLDASGNVIGVVSQKLNALAVADVTGDIPQNVNFAVNAEVVKPFLESAGAAPETAASAAPLSPAVAAERARTKVISLTASSEEPDQGDMGGPRRKDLLPDGG